MWFWMSRPSRRQPLSGSDAHTELSSQTDSPGLVPDSWDEAGALHAGNEQDLWLHFAVVVIR